MDVLSKPDSSRSVALLQQQNHQKPSGGSADGELEVIVAAPCLQFVVTNIRKTGDSQDTLVS